jgi:hypothetical protein
MPEGLKQTISGKPNLIIDLPRSDEATRIGGYIDRINGHNVNHIVIGNLGELEIVLVACDDGDVIAYFTNSIQTVILSPGTWSSMRPFFHENVESSAWGLAIHSKSRMIGVSSNKREVVIFRFGCYEEDAHSGKTKSEVSDEEHLHLLSGNIVTTQLNSTAFPTVTEVDPGIRWNNFRKCLKLGPEGHNIPSIDFANDSDGNASSILATDINGNLWIMDIWRSTGWMTRLPSTRKQNSRGNEGM